MVAHLKSDSLFAIRVIPTRFFLSISMRCCTHCSQASRNSGVFNSSGMTEASPGRGTEGGFLVLVLVLGSWLLVIGWHPSRGDSSRGHPGGRFSSAGGRFSCARGMVLDWSEYRFSARCRCTSPNSRNLFSSASARLLENLPSCVAGKNSESTAETAWRSSLERADILRQSASTSPGIGPPLR